MAGRAATDAITSEMEPLKAYLVGQPRRVRFFNERLEVVWTNRPDDAALAFGQGQESVPPPGAERDSWPVSLVFKGIPSAIRLYAGDDETPKWKITAWPLFTEIGLLAVEETERLASPDNNETAIKKLDQDIEELLHHVFDHLHGGVNNTSLRLPNPHLVKCLDDRACTNKRCAAYGKPAVDRCWEVTAFKTTDGNGHLDILSKFHSCSECRVFDLASPNSMTRIAENFNRLISLLQLKYQETLDLQHRMQQADKLAVMGELLAGIAHEIKNPLGIIIGRLDVIGLEMETMDQEVLAEDITTIYEQTHRVRHIIDHLLRMARPEPPAFKQVHMNVVVMDSLEMVRKTLSAKKIEVTVNLHPDLPAIQADQIQMQQVLLNLVLNARDAMSEGGHLVVTTHLKEDGEHRGIEIDVADDGEGMSPEVMKRLFSSFRTTKLSQGGTGLGLAVCRKIMELHRGRISAESVQKLGTTMRLWFPLRDGR